MDLFITSFSSLYLEVFLIRWLSGKIPILSFFANAILLASFFGLGLGFLMGRKKSLITYAAIAFSLLPFLIALAAQLEFFGMHREVLFIPRADLEFGISPYWAPIGCFVWTSLILIPLGQRMAWHFEKLSRLKAYTLNVVGSLAGVLFATLLSYTQVRPIFGFCLIGFAFLYFVYPNLHALLFVFILFIPAAFLTWSTERGSFWSPYQRITVSPLFLLKDKNILWNSVDSPGSSEQLIELPKSFGFRALSNALIMQDPQNLSDEFARDYPFLHDIKLRFELPFRLYHPKNVLVVGAGAGNDVAAALRMGAEHVDAVDIDPVFLGLGKDHPEHPYDNPRVQKILNDGRATFHQLKGPYDMVLFGTLDARSMFSSMSTVRIDSFIYTTESFEGALQLLGPKGVLAIRHTTGNFWVGAKLYDAIQRASGNAPTCFDALLSPLFTSGPGKDLYDRAYSNLLLTYKGDPASNLGTPTDDWPFLYLKGKVIPREYLIMLAFILCISSISLIPFLKKPNGESAHYFFLGAGFMLLETRSITTMGLLFGSTWLVNSIVFASVLMMILLANQIEAKFKLGSRIGFIGIIICLLILYMFPLQVLVGFPMEIKMAAAFLLIGAPIFSAGLIFAHSFLKSQRPDHHMGVNLLGAMTGGIMEYLCMIVGLRAMIFFALGFYLLAFFLLPGRRRIFS